MSDHAIHLALRTAAGHSRAAAEAEARGARDYEMKMRSAGAAVYEAWGLAVREQPEYQGRKIDDKALRRIYESTKARPWWDVHVRAVKVDGKPADREWAKRTMQWHIDPDAARARRAQAVVRVTAHNKRVRAATAAQASRPRPAAQGVHTPQAFSVPAWSEDAPSTAAVREFARKVVDLEILGAAGPAGFRAVLDSIDRLFDRARLAVRRIDRAEDNLAKLAEAEALVRSLVEALEAL